MGKMIIDQEYNKLFLEIKTRVTASRYRAFVTVNNELISLYHHIGNIILEAQEKEGWGAKIIDQLSRDLRKEFPEMKGFSTRNLKYMRKFAKAYPDIEFVQEVLAQIIWYHKKRAYINRTGMLYNKLSEIKLNGLCQRLVKAKCEIRVLAADPAECRVKAKNPNNYHYG